MADTCLYKELDGNCCHPSGTRSCSCMSPEPDVDPAEYRGNDYGDDEPKPFNEDEEGCSVEEVRVPWDEHSNCVEANKCKDALYVCFQCTKRSTYLFADGRCSKCTRMTPEEEGAW